MHFIFSFIVKNVKFLVLLITSWVCVEDSEAASNLCADTPLLTSTKTWISSTCSLTTITHHRSQQSTITHHSTGMEVSSRCQPSLTTLQIRKCLHAVNHHSPIYRYGSVFTLSTITHHSTGMAVSSRCQPSLTTLQVWKCLYAVNHHSPLYK